MMANAIDLKLHYASNSFQICDILYLALLSTGPNRATH